MKVFELFIKWLKDVFFIIFIVCLQRFYICKLERFVIVSLSHKGYDILCYVISFIEKLLYFPCGNICSILFGASIYYFEGKGASIYYVEGSLSVFDQFVGLTRKGLNDSFTNLGDPRCSCHKIW